MTAWNVPKPVKGYKKTRDSEFFNASIGQKNKFNFDFANCRKIIVVVPKITLDFLQDFISIFDTNPYLEVNFSTDFGGVATKDYYLYESYVKSENDNAQIKKNFQKFINKVLHITVILPSIDNFTFQFSKIAQHMYIVEDAQYTQTKMDVFGTYRKIFPPGVSAADLIIYVNNHCETIGYPCDVVHKNRVISPMSNNLREHINHCMLLKTDPMYRVHESPINFFEL